MASSLAAKLIKDTAKNSRVSILTQSKFFDKECMVSTDVPMVNALHSGHFDGGPTPGSVMLVGDSRTFKTNMCLFNCSEFLKKYEDAVMIYVDAEFGAAKAYFDNFQIDTDRVIHIPIEDVEQMTFETVQIIDKIEKGDKIIVLVDSVSQVASKKEAQDALDGKGVADMTRAKSLNSFWRIITPKLNLKSIPLYAINSYYDSITDKYAEKNIKGGKQGFLSADAVWMVTRSKEKDKDGNLEGFTFNYKIMKSRFVKEGSVFPIRVTFDGGIDRYSGLWDLLREGGFIDMPSNAWYVVTPKCKELKNFPEASFNTEKFRRADLEAPIWMEQFIALPAFREYIKDVYSLSGDAKLIRSLEETGEVDPPAPSPETATAA